MVHQVRGTFRHAAPAATGTESTTVAREGYEAILAAPIAMKSSKATCQAPTGQKVAELPLDESRQALTVAKRRRLDARLVVVSESLKQRRKRPRAWSYAPFLLCSIRRMKSATISVIILCVILKAWELPNASP